VGKGCILLPVQSYRVYVQNQLDASWQSLLEGFALEPQADGSTLLSGSVADQAALFGVLVRLRDMGLVILRVEQASGPHSAEP
jgi:hypothetical protein